jgi:hypothetical protein
VNLLLAYAESTPPSDQNVWFVVIGIGVIAAAAFLAFVPIALARVRQHPFVEFISVAAIFLGLIAAGTVIYSIVQQTKWSNEQTLRLQSGYGNPDDLSDAPTRPWLIWMLMGVAYCAMIAWALTSKRRSDSRRP